MLKDFSQHNKYLSFSNLSNFLFSHCKILLKSFLPVALNPWNDTIPHSVIFQG